jgi:hypothetical protein
MDHLLTFLRNDGTAGDSKLAQSDSSSPSPRRIKPKASTENSEGFRVHLSPRDVRKSFVEKAQKSSRHKKSEEKSEGMSRWMNTRHVSSV